MNNQRTESQCPSCGGQVMVEAIYCGYCASPIDTVDESATQLSSCGECARQMPTSARFCGYCGTPSSKTISHDSIGKPNSDSTENKTVSTYPLERIEPDVVIRQFPVQSDVSPTTRAGSRDVSSIIFEPDSSSSSMVPKILALVTVAMIVIGVYWKLSKQSAPNDAPSTSQTAPPAAAPRNRILTKDPEYMRLLNPVQVEASLDASTEHASKLTGFLQRHQDDWFEVGHIEYPGTNVLQISSVAASPIELPDGATIPMDDSTIDGVYAKFRELAKSQIEQEANAWMSEQSCTNRLRNVCENLGGTPEECSSPSKLKEVEEAVAGGGVFSGCSDNPSSEEGRERAEKQIRENRLVLVGQGDLIAHRIDKLLLVDYETETALLEISPSELTGKLDWKFPSDSQASAPVTTLEQKSSGPNGSEAGQVPELPVTAAEQSNYSGGVENTDTEPPVQRNPQQARKLNAEGLKALAGLQPNLIAAKSSFQKAVQFDPDYVEALNNLGDVYGELEDYGMAEQILAKVLAMASTRRVALGNMGYHCCPN